MSLFKTVGKFLKMFIPMGQTPDGNYSPMQFNADGKILTSENAFSECLNAEDKTITITTRDVDHNPTLITYTGGGYTFTETITYDVDGNFETSTVTQV